ncbi:peptidoglycan D,D-transpeptidase FtsI family protein [Candidatus Clostridium stratigraminis]|uniref:Peptidoglycan D,D-transpeptidase FtsI family protein n=1 Tax=Candidatus Clostridium stratigraminis TaxID=3381661 RepID=A0ABW8T114_9CLOT
MKKKVHKKMGKRGRLFFIFSVLTIFYLILMGRLLYIMVEKGSTYKAMAVSQRTHEIPLDPKRGNILDRNGQVLASSADVYRIDADPSLLQATIKNKDLNLDEISKNLASYLSMNTNDILKKLSSKDNSGNLLKFVSLKRQVEKPSADGIKALKLNGIIVSSDTIRYYPNKNFMAQVLGLTNIEGKGISGVEQSYDKALTGIEGSQKVQLDAHGNVLPDTATTIQPVNGKDVSLTIDERIQELAEKAASSALEANKATSVSIMVMNPKNGEILAMASKPDFDPNNPNKVTSAIKNPQDLWVNRSVENIFEPGSIFKVITSAAAMENNALKDGDTFNDTGSIKVANTTIYDDDKKNHGIQTFSDILNNSSNVGFILLAQKLGKDNLYNYSKEVGIGDKTGVDLPKESSGIIKDLNNIGPVDLATMSFGHGVALTQVQFMAAFNAVANGGTWIRPHIMKDIEHKDGDNRVVDDEFKDLGKKTVMTEGNSAKLRNYLEGVVTKGTAVATYIDGFHIAGKTGTAERVDSNKRGYQEGKYVSSFVGMAPASDPVVSLIVTIDEPNSSNYFAAQTAVPVAKELFTGISNYITIK